MTVATTNTNVWSKDELLKKSQRYAAIMCSHSKDSWEYAFWSTLVLELLGRASLSNVSPTLLADAKDWNNIYSALGHAPKAQKFIPKSIDISSVFTRLKEVISGFTTDNVSFSILHMSRRNSELHSADAPFDSIKNSAWLPSFYQTSEILLISMGESLELLIGKPEAKIAKKMIAAANDDSAKIIAKTVNGYKVVWESNNELMKKKLSEQASAWATKQNGHRVKCPSCESDALVTGEASAAPIKTIKDDLITEKQEYMPNKFECIACGLKVTGLSHLSACGLNGTFTATHTYDAVDYYTPIHDDDPFDGYEPDFND